MTDSTFQRVIANDYDAIVSEGVSLPTARYYDDAIIACLPDRCGIVVDAGCGTGELTGKLVHFARRILAIDVSRVTIDVARTFVRSEGAKFKVAAVEELPTIIAPAACSAIVLNRVLHHCSALQQVIASLLSLLEPGGRLIILDLECTGHRCSSFRRSWLHMMYRASVMWTGIQKGECVQRWRDLRTESAAYQSQEWQDHLSHEPEFEWQMVRDALTELGARFTHRRMNWRFHLFVAERL